jgi:hypothetical protein
VQHLHPHLFKKVKHCHSLRARLCDHLQNNMGSRDGANVDFLLKALDDHDGLAVKNSALGMTGEFSAHRIMQAITIDSCTIRNSFLSLEPKLHRESSSIYSLYRKSEIIQVQPKMFIVMSHHIGPWRGSASV